MTAVIGRAAVAPLNREPSLRAEQVTQLVLGETARLEESRGEWRRVTGQLDGYGGWVHAGYVLEVEDAAAERWRDEAVGWSLGAVLRVDELRLRVPIRARVMLADGAAQLPDGRQGEVIEGAIAPAPAVVAEARRSTPRHWALAYFGGAPYEWGGVTAWGVDCSGLVQTAFAARGIAVPRDSSQQVELGEPIEVDAICPGDLLFFRGEQGSAITHVAFAAESDTLIHSTVSCGGVLREPWLPGTRAAALRDKLVAVRRVCDV